MSKETRKALGKLFLTKNNYAYEEYYNEFKEEIDSELNPTIEKETKIKTKGKR